MMNKAMTTTTLVDQVEEKIMDYIKVHKLTPGSSLPNEAQFSEMLGTSRNVVRESLSRLKMIGLIETRTKRGMVLKELSIIEGLRRGLNPNFLNEETLFDLIGFRVALEIGICDDIFHNVNQKDIDELEEIVRLSVMLQNNEYALMSEYNFHAKLYQITKNETIAQFQELIRPIIIFIKDNFKSYFEPINLELEQKGLIVTHDDLLAFLKTRDLLGYRKALENHFLLYKIFLRERMKRKQSLNEDLRKNSYTVTFEPKSGQNLTSVRYDKSDN